MKLTTSKGAYSLDDLTLEAWERIETESGTNWREFSPAASARHARIAWREVLVAQGLSRFEAERAVSTLTLADFAAGLPKAEEPVVDDLPTEFVDGVPPVAAEG